MATKKTKNARNATEYIDSAGVKLNNNADLIIEANAAGEVVSARNVITGTEYVGGGGGSALFINVGGTLQAPAFSASGDDVLAAINSKAAIWVEVADTLIGSNIGNSFIVCPEIINMSSDHAMLLVKIQLRTDFDSTHVLPVIAEMRINAYATENLEIFGNAISTYSIPATPEQ